ncbi:MAG: DedA family protein [Cryobacterium sp.]|nr:DedA family protein [Cryobacterium sp.]
MDAAWITDLANSVWLLPVVFALVVADAFLVIVPSESAVVALGTLWASTGAPPIWAVVLVAAAGAIVGDSVCFCIGRRVGTERWAWQRRGRVKAALGRAASLVEHRTALLVFTARYVPFARIAVNLTAGASALPYRRYLPLSAAAGLAWAIYNVTIGALVGNALSDAPLLAIPISIIIAVLIGLVLDRIISKRVIKSGERPPAGPESGR